MPDIRSDFVLPNNQLSPADHHRSSLLANSNPTALLELLETFKSYLRALDDLKMSPNTRRVYETRLQHFLGFLGSRLKMYPGALTDATVRDQVAQDYTQYLKASIGSSDHTINAYLTAIDSFFIFVGLGKVGIARKNTANVGPQALRSAELDNFQAVIDRCKRARDIALAVLFLNTAIRVSECSALNVGDVILTGRSGSLQIRNNKTGASRRVPLNSVSKRALEDWMVERRLKFSSSRDQALFLSNRGTRLSTDAIDHAIRKLAKDAKLQGVSSDTLRQTCLVNLLWQQVDVATVAKIAGHKKTETTMRYRL
jgi:integrase/recombinase XerD